RGAAGAGGLGDIVSRVIHQGFYSHRCGRSLAVQTRRSLCAPTPEKVKRQCVASGEHSTTRARAAHLNSTGDRKLLCAQRPRECSFVCCRGVPRSSLTSNVEGVTPRWTIMRLRRASV